jgi:hypothetical protein
MLKRSVNRRDRTSQRLIVGLLRVGLLAFRGGHVRGISQPEKALAALAPRTAWSFLVRFNWLTAMVDVDQGVPGQGVLCATRNQGGAP